jgi:hypothetical protein
MKPVSVILTILAITAGSLSAQVNASERDTALRRFLGVRSVGSSIPISQPATCAFVTALFFKDGHFWKRDGDSLIQYSFGQTPIALGNPTAGYAPASLQVEFLWGPREGKVGYLFQAGVGSTGTVREFSEMPELADINTTLSDIYADPAHPQYDGMILLGAAYALTRKPAETTVEASIEASQIAVVIVFREFQSQAEADDFLKLLNEKYKS